MFKVRKTRRYSVYTALCVLFRDPPPHTHIHPQMCVDMSIHLMQCLNFQYERLRVKVIQAVYSAPGAKPPQKEISDAAIHYTMQVTY